MPLLPIIMPQLGESIAEATIVSAAYAVGDRVEADADLLEVETNKAVMGVTAPCGGVLKELTATIGESYAVGATLGYLEISEEDADRLGLNDLPPPPVEKPKKKQSSGSEVSTSEKKLVKPTVSGLPVPAHAGGASFLSPRMKARMAELGLHAADLAGVAGSGAGGRVTIDDLERFLQDLERNTISPASSMRVAVADAMRRSWTRPLATVVLPVQLDTLLAHRKQQTVKAETCNTGGTARQVVSTTGQAALECTVRSSQSDGRIATVRSSAVQTVKSHDSGNLGAAAQIFRCCEVKSRGVNAQTRGACAGLVGISTVTETVGTGDRDLSERSARCSQDRQSNECFFHKD